jgi:hypothetical protein
MAPGEAQRLRRAARLDAVRVRGRPKRDAFSPEAVVGESVRQDEAKGIETAVVLPFGAGVSLASRPHRP